MVEKVRRSSLDLRVIKGLKAMMETRVLKVSVQTWGVGAGGACRVLRPMVQVVHLPWTNRTLFTYLLKSALCIPFNYCKCTVFYNLNRSQSQKVSLTSK